MTGGLRSGGPDLAPVAVNLLGFAEHAELGETPYRVSRSGEPYVPAGDGGIVLGLQLGDSVFALAGDHAAPGACLVHPDPPARLALATYACIGNRAEVRTGAAVGARGAVIGKRGEEGRVIAVFGQADLERLRPGDEITVRARGQGWRPPGFPADVSIMNVDPEVLGALPIGWSGAVAGGSGGVSGAAVGGRLGAVAGGGPVGAAPVGLGPVGLGPVGGGPVVTAGVRGQVPGWLAGNGIGRPAAGWDLDLQLTTPDSGGIGDIVLGDLVAVTDIDARYNMGYRRGWVTVGVVVHGASPLPGHGPGITPILTGPAAVLRPVPDPDHHVGLTAAGLKLQ